MRIAVVTLFLVGTVACGASLPPPNTEWAEANNDVGKAEAGGAPSVPDAKLHLQLAQEDLQKSKELINQDNRRAASLVAVARAEAQLALSLAKAQQKQAEARSAQEALQKTKGGQ
jgi:multidrug efflux pump subunit AcrA (membrane-fusion protein)